MKSVEKATLALAVIAKQDKAEDLVINSSIFKRWSCQAEEFFTKFCSTPCNEHVVDNK